MVELKPERDAIGRRRRVYPSVRDRFPKFCSPEPNSGCWLWLGAVIPKGYGMIGDNGKVRLATHVSLELDGRERPSPKHWALHRCDTPACVNPDHLYWGTAQDNVDDMMVRGRHFSPRKERCVRGHRLIETAYVRGDGYRQCRECDKARSSNRRRGAACSN